MKTLVQQVLSMPSLLGGCFCVRPPRHDFGKRKRESQKRILHRGSDSGSEHSTVQEVHIPAQPQQESKKNEDEEIMSRLLGNHQTPRRRHVEDIFRPDAPEVKAASRKSSLNSCHNQPSDDTMHGYVPRAVSTMSASTALTGEKFDDFFHDCRMNPALDKFAKPSNIHNSPMHMFPNKRPSVVQLEMEDDMYATPTHVEIKISDAKTAFDGVIRGSVSSASPSPTPSEELSSTPDSTQHCFLDQDEYDLGYTLDPVQSTFNSLFVRDPIGLKDKNEHGCSMDAMFHRDGEVLY